MGAVLLVFGALFFFVFAVLAGRAAADFASCITQFPTPGFMKTCVDAMNAMWLDQVAEGIGGVGAILGFVLLILGIVLEPERPVTVTYPPPAYATPPDGSQPYGPRLP